MPKLKLFSRTEINLKKAIEHVVIEDIRQLVSSAMYYKGKNYYENERIIDAAFIGDNKLAAKIEGTERYNTILTFEYNHLYANCNCPFDGICKHIVALLIYSIKKHGIIEQVPAPSTDKIVLHLQSLSKEELIDLILKFAPQIFIDNITSQFADKKEALRLYNRASSRIGGMFHDEELLYNPSGFEKELMENLKKIRGLWDKFPDEIGNLLLEIMEDIDEAFDEGYLYADDYYHEDYFESDDFDDYVVAFTKSLQQDMKFDYIDRVEDTINNCGYSTFEGIKNNFSGFFNKDDLPILKNQYIASIKRKEINDPDQKYITLLPILSDDEKELILKSTFHFSSFLALELANFYQKRDQNILAINVLEEYLPGKDRYKIKEEIYILLLGLLSAENQPLGRISKQALTHFSTAKMLKLILSYLPSQNQFFEDILEKEDSNQLLEYLQSKKRLEECVELIERGKVSQNNVYSFFVRYKTSFPEKAEKLFLQTIDENLKSTGDRYYQAIVDALSEIKQIHPSKALELVGMLRSDYKRRRNLMKLLTQKKF